MFDADGFLREHVASTSHDEAFSGWASVLRRLVSATGPELVMEVGGGRSPLWQDAVGVGDGTTLVVNDISQAELDRLPATTRTAQFDISEPDSIPAHLEGAVDLVFSQSVMEHVASTDRAMESTYRLLRPGGVGFHFFPTLWASPFAVNKLIPFGLTKPLVRLLLRPRYERFPALYRQTRSVESQMEAWRQIGFSQVAVFRFYGHSYYRGIPVLRDIEDAVTRRAEQRGWHWYSSYAYVLLVK